MTARNKKTGSKPAAARSDYWKKKQELEKKKEKRFNQRFFYDWCKRCGICSAFCPKKIITLDKDGRPVVHDPDSCIGCRFCELHCPDFAISISERYPDRRRKMNDGD